MQVYSFVFILYSKRLFIPVCVRSWVCTQNSALSTVLALKAFAGAGTLAGAATAAAGAPPAATVALPGAISATVHSVRVLRSTYPAYYAISVRGVT